MTLSSLIKLIRPSSQCPSVLLAPGLALLLVLASANPACGGSEAEEAMNRVSLQAESSKQVANDLMQATLAVEAEDRDPAKLADTVNRTMTWALEKARAAEGVTLQSGGYQTHPVRRQGEILRWRASQQLLVEGQETDRVTALIGELQSRLQLKALSFTVSPEQRRATENELIDAALDVFKARAEIVRKNLGASGYRIVEVSIRTSERPPVHPMGGMRQMAAAMESVTPPAVEAGTSKVTVRVTGTVQLD